MKVAAVLITDDNAHEAGRAAASYRRAMGNVAYQVELYHADNASRNHHCHQAAKQRGFNELFTTLKKVSVEDMQRRACRELLYKSIATHVIFIGNYGEQTPPELITAFLKRPKGSAVKMLGAA